MPNFSRSICVSNVIVPRYLHLKPVFQGQLPFHSHVFAVLPGDDLLLDRAVHATQAPRRINILRLLRAALLLLGSLHVDKGLAVAWPCVAASTPS